jgi:hypothetical protein
LLLGASCLCCLAGLCIAGLCTAGSSGRRRHSWSPLVGNGWLELWKMISIECPCVSNIWGQNLAGAATWELSGWRWKSKARAWQEHGKNLARAWRPSPIQRCPPPSMAKPPPTNGRRARGEPTPPLGFWLCFVCMEHMDVWQLANRSFACPKCNNFLHFHCTEVCTICHVDLCPLHCAADQRDCPVVLRQQKQQQQ